MNIQKLSVRQLQWLIWFGVALVVFFSTVAEDPLPQAVTFMLINVSFYAVIIYGNISFLYPRFYETGRKVEYVIYSIIYVVGFAIGRGYFAVSLYNHYFAKTPENITPALIFAFIAGGFLDFMMSLIFRIALAYFKLKQQSDRAELNLLKAQLQPHFLFNTLNNIYYEIYTEAPRSAKLIEQLSEIMRYFTDESPKDQVQLSAEVTFIENYIALETIRLRYGADIRIDKTLTKDLMVPPMLLMTLVENVFKHGIDPQKNSNVVSIKLFDQNGFLYFETVNTIIEKEQVPHGLGLKNLKERLTILYKNLFELNCKEENGLYYASLKIPVQ